MSDNAERFAREIRLVRVYGNFASLIMVLSALTLLCLIALDVEALNAINAGAFFLCIMFAALYQYFSVRFLINLGTRYDLMPIIKRSLLLQGLSNRPVLYYVFSMLAFLLAWASLVWSAV